MKWMFILALQNLNSGVKRDSVVAANAAALKCMPVVEKTPVP